MVRTIGASLATIVALFSQAQAYTSQEVLSANCAVYLTYVSEENHAVFTPDHRNFLVGLDVGLKTALLDSYDEFLVNFAEQCARHQAHLRAVLTVSVLKTLSDD